MKRQPSGSRRAASTPVLGERRIPMQARAQETVDRILEAAAELLAETGIDSFNTNALAEHAGERVRSIYRYFPNKFAILAALWKKMIEEWDLLLLPALRQVADPKIDIMIGFHAMSRAYLRWIETRPGAWALRNTIRAVPELLEQEQSAEAWFVSHFAAALAQRGVNLPRRRLELICSILYRSINAVAHAEFIYHHRPRRSVMKEMDVLVNTYLTVYVPRSSPAGSRRDKGA